MTLLQRPYYDGDLKFNYTHDVMVETLTPRNFKISICRQGV